MKKLSVLFVFILSLGGYIGTSLAQSLPERPVPPRLVNDFAGMLSPAERDNLERKLVQFDDSTSNQIAVVTIDSLGEYDASDYAIKLFQKWQIGVAKKNNGVLVLISKKEHKTWISVGYGLEGAITDALSKRFVDQDIIPAFKQGKYYAGLDLATTHLMQLAKGEYHEPRPDTGTEVQGNGLGFLPILIILIILIILFTRGGGNQVIGGGGGFPFGFLLGALFNSGRGDSWGGNGGGFGGGDGGGGGFGGFGGGDTGGGGAGGSW